MTGLTPISQNTHQTGYNKPYAYKDKNPPQANQRGYKRGFRGLQRDIREFYFYCRQDQTKRAGTILKSRGLKQETLDRFLLFSVKDYQATDKHLKSKFSTDELSKGGHSGRKGQFDILQAQNNNTFFAGRQDYIFTGQAIRPRATKVFTP